MKTELSPTEVKFDQEGYLDLVTKIENLERSEKRKIKLINQYEKSFKNIMDNLQRAFNVGNIRELNQLQFEDKEIMVIFNQMNSDKKPTLQVR